MEQLEFWFINPRTITWNHIRDLPGPLKHWMSSNELRAVFPAFQYAYSPHQQPSQDIYIGIISMNERMSSSLFVNLLEDNDFLEQVHDFTHTGRILINFSYCGYNWRLRFFNSFLHYGLRGQRFNLILTDPSNSRSKSLREYLI